KVFPDGRTVHVPSDGRPLPGYALALADIQQRGSSGPSETSLAAAREAGVNVDAPAAGTRQRSLFSALFGAKDEDEDRQTAAASAPKPDPKAEKRRDTRVAEAKPAAPKPAEKTVALTPTRPAEHIAAKVEPKAVPAQSFNLASAESRPVALSAPSDAGA